MMELATQPNIREKIVEAFEESGIVLDNGVSGDIDLSIFVEDSIHFISMVVAIEEKLSIEFPDDLLILEAFKSLNALSNSLKGLT